MADPTEIWGTYGESSGGAGTGGPTPNDPDGTGTYANCSDIEPDVPAGDNLVWYNVKVCDDIATTTEWVVVTDETYTLNSVYRVDEIDGLGVEQCVHVTDDRSTGIGEAAPDVTFPQGNIICGGYADCDECNATCYKITDCLTAAIYYSNNTAYAGVTGFQSVIDGRCYTVAVESDKSQCCPDNVIDDTPAGTYLSCSECDQAINPQPTPCTCSEDSAGITSLSLTITSITKYSSDGATWSEVCTIEGISWTLAEVFDCYWESAETDDCEGVENIGTPSLTLDTTGGDCHWYIVINGASSAVVGTKYVGDTPYGGYTFDTTLGDASTLSVAYIVEGAVVS